MNYSLAQIETVRKTQAGASWFVGGYELGGAAILRKTWKYVDRLWIGTRKATNRSEFGLWAV